jgi:ABC-type transporter Mla subunit MlaD
MSGPPTPCVASSQAITYLTGMSDRNLGYLLIALLFLIVVVIGSYGIRPLISQGEKRVVAFTEIGNLRHQDPVRVRGVLYGTCKDIKWIAGASWRKPLAYVTIQTDKSFPIRRGYRIINMDEGVMGDRMIMIDCGDSSAPLVPIGDTLVGTFYHGVSEALNNAWILRGVMDTLLEASETLSRGVRGGKSLITQVNGIVASVDSASMLAIRVTRKTDLTIAAQMRKLDSYVKAASDGTRSFESTAPGLIEHTDILLKDLSEFIVKLNGTTDTLIVLARSLRDPNNVLWKTDAENIRKRILDLQAVITMVKNRLIEFNGLF